MTARGCLWHRRSPLKRSTGRLSRQPVEPELQKETDGRIDRSEVRDTPWDPLARKGRWFVWNSRRGNHLGQRSTKPHQQAGHMDASDPIRPSKTLAARGPSTYGSLLSQGRRECGVRVGELHQHVVAHSANTTVVPALSRDPYAPACVGRKPAGPSDATISYGGLRQ